MRHYAFAVLVFLAVTASLTASSKLLVTVVESKSAKPVTGLKAEDFTVLEEKTACRVESAEYESAILDVVLLLDTSLAGAMVQPVADNMIAQLQPKEQMAVVAFHSSADLIQDFTSSKDLLGRAVAQVKYGNSPHVLDGLYATVDGGFQNSTFRRVVLLVTAGIEGNSRVTENEVVNLARRNGVSIFVVYAMGYEKWMFEMLARETGGAVFNLKNMRKASEAPPGPRIFEVLRSHYTLTVGGKLSTGQKLKIEVKRPEKLFTSALPLD
jgi:VWFA-related protein